METIPSCQLSAALFTAGTRCSRQEHFTFLVLLVVDFTQPPNLSLSHASSHTQQSSLSIITQQGALQPSYGYLTILKNNNNNKDTFMSTSLGLKKGQHWCLASQTHPLPYSRWLRTCQYKYQTINFKAYSV